ncbi:MAG: leucine-rich repeat domain-containing protein [Candidatus Neomarinimicrobiota bacterium]
MLRKTPYLILLLAISLPARAQVLESDSLALVALYNSTDGANWTNNTGWLTGPVSNWNGVNVLGGRVTRILLYTNNLSGPIPAQLGNLSNLNELFIPDNGLTGSIPEELGNLANLTSLSLDANQLIGSIPAELGILANLQSLSLDQNQLTGFIPAELGNLANLTSLTLEGNNLTGSIPTELGNLANLQWLNLGTNQLSGYIPAELGNLANLTFLRLHSNQLTGSIPAGLGNLANLQWLYLGFNRLTGSLPVELGNLVNLETLYLNSNQLTGLPDLSTLTALSVLKVPSNRLTFEDLEPNMGVASTNFTYAPQDSVGAILDTILYPDANLILTVSVGGSANVYQWIHDGLDITGATTDTYTITGAQQGDTGAYVLKITNTIATGLTLYSRPMDVTVYTGLQVDSLALVALYDSTDGANWTTTWNLNTPVNTWYGVTVSGGQVTEVNLNQSNLNGPIPAELGNLANLTYLYLGSNQLSGPIPAELGNLANLTQLNLSSNQLSGSIPAELGSLDNLTSLCLDHNQLSGSIPAELGNLANLTRLYLSSNQLSGSIPAELGNLANLTRLYLHSTQLSGSIPAELGNLANLTVLLLYSTQLSGSIPAELGNLANLTQLHLYLNQLSGSIPVELGNLADLTLLNLSYNQLSGLPDLSTLTALEYLKVENNRLTFRDIEPNMGVASSRFTYAPQDSVGAAFDTTLYAGSNLILTVTVGGTANQYQWVKDGVELPGAISSALSISPVAHVDSGSYVLRITNTIVTGLTLYSRPIRLKVVANQEPVLTAVPDTTIQEDDTLRIVLLGSDIYGDSLTYGVTSDTSAVATTVEDSLLTIIPEPQWNGVASIIVSLNDGQFIVRDTFAVTVTPVNDPPEITSSATANATEDVYFHYTATATDPDGPTLTWTFDQRPTWLLADADSGYGTPQEGAVDSSFRVIAYDGEQGDTLIVVVTVGSVNDPPEITSSATANATEDIYFHYTATATDPDGPTLTWTFDQRPAWLLVDADSGYGTPSEGVVDTSFRVIAYDGALRDTLIVTVTVAPVNDPPLALADIATTDEDTVLVLAVLVNDSDPEFDLLIIRAVIDSGSNGLAVKDDGDTTITYTPEPNYFGPDTLEYVITDGQYTDTASVYLTILPVNDRPVITSMDTVTSTEDEYFVYHATATDLENDSLSWTFDWRPGWLQFDADSVFGTPLEGATDTSFMTVVADSALSDTILVTLSIIAVNDPPIVAHATGITVLEGDTVAVTSDALQVLDEDNSNAELQFTFAAQPSELTGEFRLSGVALADTAHFTQTDIDSGLISFAHDGSETTLDSIGFWISDTDGATAHIAYFQITIIPVNDPPEPFALLEPPADTLIHRVNEAIWDTVIFRWERALDVEEDSVTYHFADASELLLFEAQPTADTILYLIPGIVVLGINYAFVDTFRIVWSVTAHDGIDSTAATNGLRSFTLVFDYSTGIEEDGALPIDFALHQNYPNPFNPTTTIRFDLPVATDVHLAVYDLLGREVARLVDRRLEAGYHRQVWDARDARGRELPTGMYIAFMVTPEITKSIKVVLLK